jgi:alpha-tubulin suppressor-like RCC1 family protein
MIDMERVIYTVGQNAYGELILGDDQERHTFNFVQAIQNQGLSVKSVAAGNELSLVLTHSGEVWYSGYSQMNQSISAPHESEQGRRVVPTSISNSIMDQEERIPRIVSTSGDPRSNTMSITQNISDMQDLDLNDNTQLQNSGAFDLEADFDGITRNRRVVRWQQNNNQNNSNSIMRLEDGGAVGGFQGTKKIGHLKRIAFPNPID